jgi:hypothetical protein
VKSRGVVEGEIAEREKELMSGLQEETFTDPKA